MYITALCPSYRRQRLLENMLVSWLNQDYPMHLRKLIICDDGGSFGREYGKVEKFCGPNWDVYSMPNFETGLNEVFNFMVSVAPCQTDAFVVMHDDDIHLDGYVSAHARAMEHPEDDYSCPMDHYVHYGTAVHKEHRKFWDAMGFRKSLFDKIGEFPITLEPAHDGRNMDVLEKNANTIVRPWDEKSIQFCYGFASTGYPHASCSIAGYDDLEWSQKFKKAVPLVRATELKPTRDKRTEAVLEVLKSGRLGEVKW